MAPTNKYKCQDNEIENGRCAGIDCEDIDCPSLKKVLRMQKFDILHVKGIDGLQEEMIEPGDW